jgi:hypothetical protein
MSGESQQADIRRQAQGIATIGGIQTIDQKGDARPEFTSQGLRQGINDFTNMRENIFFYALMLKLAQSKEGLAIVKMCMDKLITGSMDALSDLARAGAANRITAYSSARLISLVMERFNLITQAQAVDFSISLNLITGAQAASDWINILPWEVMKTDASFPDSVNLGEKITTTSTIRGYGRMPPALRGELEGRRTVPKFGAKAKPEKGEE